MKAAFGHLLIIFFLAPTLGADPISIEEFKKIASLGERVKLIEQAPPEQKEELIKINLHLSLVNLWHGEAELKRGREFQASKARGLAPLEVVFINQEELWTRYLSASIIANEKSGMTLKERQQAERELSVSLDAIRERQPVVHSLVFRIASSPQALELASKARNFLADLGKRFGIEVTPPQPITKKDLATIDKECDQVFEEMKKLPKLTAEQAQKEIDAFPEEKMPKP